MIVSRARFFAFALMCVVSPVLTSCGGGSQHALPVQGNQPAVAADTSASASSTTAVPLSTSGGTFSLPLGNGYSGAITVHADAADGASAGSTMTLDSASSTGATTATAVRGVLTAGSSQACPNIPPLDVKNPFPFPLVFRLDSFQIHVPCSVDGKLFSVGIYQLKPMPAVVTVQKLGDAGGVGNEVSFTPVVNKVTLPPKTTEVLLVTPESSTAGVPIPVIPGATTMLTSGTTNMPSTLSLNASSAQGASQFTSSCANAYQNGVLAPQLAGTPLVGTPSFFCNLDPGAGAITFDAPITFYVGSPNSDASVLGLDGPTETFLCTQAPSSASCGTPTFAIDSSSSTAFKNVVVGNAADLQICSPAWPNTDCNAASNPAQSTTTVPAGKPFQILVEDDPTYGPNDGPWDGMFRTSLNGPCAFARSYQTPWTAPSNLAPLHHSPSPAPSSSPGVPGYSLTGFGPKAEFDIVPTGTGVCTLTASEDPRYITADFSNPANPIGRTISLAITIQQQSHW